MTETKTEEIGSTWFFFTLVNSSDVSYIVLKRTPICQIWKMTRQVFIKLSRQVIGQNSTVGVSTMQKYDIKISVVFYLNTQFIYLIRIHEKPYDTHIKHKIKL